MDVTFVERPWVMLLLAIAGAFCYVSIENPVRERR